MSWIEENRSSLPLIEKTIVEPNFSTGSAAVDATLLIALLQQRRLTMGLKRMDELRQDAVQISLASELTTLWGNIVPVWAATVACV